MDTVLVVLSYLCMFAVAAAAAAAWRRRSARITAFGVAAFGSLVVSYHVLGVLAAVTDRPVVRPSNVVLVSGALCVAAWSVRWLTLRRRAGAGGRGVSEGASAASGSVSETPTTRQRGLECGGFGLGVPVAAAVIVGGFLTCAAVSGLSAPPRGWDILAYHLPRTLSWLHHGDLGVYGSTGAFYPANGGLPILSLLFTGSDRLVPIVQLPFALLAGVALFGLAREIGATVRSAAIAGLVLLASPIVFFQATIAKDDLVVTAMVLAGALFLARSLRSGIGANARLAEVASAGLALGLALGTKYSILPYVAGSIPLLAFLHALRCEPGPGAPRFRETATALGVFVLAVAVPSAFWFVRNAVVAGNPVAPLSLRVGEWIASPAIDKELQFVGSPAGWWFFPWTDRQLVAGYSGAAGYGAAFAAFLVPGLVLGVRGAASRVRHSSARLPLAAVLLSIALGVVGWWFGRYHLPRLLLPVVGLACAPIGLVFDAVSRGARAVLVVVLACGLAVSAAETLRVVFAGKDITWSYCGVDRRQFYRMPDLIYELAPGTRVLLLRPSADAYYETYRYPLAGELPGNDVVMEDDVGMGTNLRERGARAGHADLIERGVDCVFLRVLGVRRFETWFDEHPDLYEEVLDAADPGYPWYRQTYAVSETGEILGRAIVMTKMYRVLPRVVTP